MLLEFTLTRLRVLTLCVPIEGLFNMGEIGTDILP